MTITCGICNKSFDTDVWRPGVLTVRLRETGQVINTIYACRECSLRIAQESGASIKEGS